MATTSPAATLLFAHGGGFCKQIWEPIIRRMRASPLLQTRGVRTDFVSFDFLYHGSKRDESVAPQLDLDGPGGPRVRHPAQDLVSWTTEEMRQQVRAIREKHRGDEPKPALIGIGHSMGAGAMWNTEVQDPGTFDALILFEPVYGAPSREAGDKVSDFLVSLTLQRESSWPSRAAAEEHFANFKNFAGWDREALAAYLQGALVEDETTGTTVLACHPHIEASLYCHKILFFSDQELPRAKCPVRFHSGDRSNMFFKPFFEDAVAKHPEIYSIGEPMAKCSHLMVLEKPDMAAAKVLDDLAMMAPFRQHLPSRI
ncbi:hypothetical protein BBJ28_00010443 [Nothophytophthora sp. Chile5]|nr:hypothetical protein BBJ28_00010443 [Nothophytophthora sp. Chile5]